MKRMDTDCSRKGLSVHLRLSGSSLVGLALASALSCTCVAQEQLRVVQMTSEQLQQSFNEMTRAGYVPTFISGYAVPGEGTRFDETFAKLHLDNWSSQVGLSDGDFLRKDAELVRLGYQLVSYSRYLDTDRYCHAGIWHLNRRVRPDPQETFHESKGHIFRRLTAATWIEQRPDGQICAYEEIARTPVYVELYDSQRTLYLRLGRSKGVWSYDQTDWRRWPTGRWVVKPSGLIQEDDVQLVAAPEVESYEKAELARDADEASVLSAFRNFFSETPNHSATEPLEDRWKKDHVGKYRNRGGLTDKTAPELFKPHGEFKAGWAKDHMDKDRNRDGLADKTAPEIFKPTGEFKDGREKDHVGKYHNRGGLTDKTAPELFKSAGEFKKPFGEFKAVVLVPSGVLLEIDESAKLTAGESSSVNPGTAAAARQVSYQGQGEAGEATRSLRVKLTLQTTGSEKDVLEFDYLLDRDQPKYIDTTALVLERQQFLSRLPSP